MAQDEIKLFLANMKLVYEHGVSHSRNKARLHRFLAIHNCHYVVEQILRERAKNMTFKAGPLQKIGFEEIIKRLNVKKTIQGYNYLLRLNKTRNDAEHSNMLPDSDEVVFFVGIVRDFLKWSCKEYFQVDFDSIAFEDRIYDIPIRNRMIEAKSLITQEDFLGASLKMYEALGAFKFMWFGFLVDIRFENIKDMSEAGLSLAEGLVDFAFKIILSEDEATLEELSKIRTSFTRVDGKITGVGSRYLAPLTFKDKEEANTHYENILNIILTYQDRIPNSIWRKNE